MTDKFASYVFSALPVNITTKEQLFTEVIKNVNVTASKIANTSTGFQVRSFHQLWNIADANGMAEVQDYIFKNYLKKAAIANNDQKLVDELEMASTIKNWVQYPNITWEINGKKKSLSTIDPAENYLLIFWSSTCSHCLKELPTLHKELKEYEDLKVIAVGLEDDAINWKKYLPHYLHLTTPLL